MPLHKEITEFQRAKANLLPAWSLLVHFSATFLISALVFLLACFYMQHSTQFTTIQLKSRKKHFYHERTSGEDK